MPDNTTDDVYNDPDNVLADTDDAVNGAVELPDDQKSAISQSIFTPEKTAPGDDRDTIPELEQADGGAAHDEMSRTDPEESDSDSFHPGDVMPADENDRTES